MLQTPIETLNGIGEKKKQLLNKLGIKTYEDVLTNYPFRYVDRRKVLSVSVAKDQEQVVIRAKVAKIQMKKFKKEMMILEVVDHFASGEILFFSPKYLKNTFEVGKTYLFFGKIEKRSVLFKMIQPEYAKDGDSSFLGIIPVYDLTLGLSNKDMINIHRQVLVRAQSSYTENLPTSIVRMAKICSRQEAFENIHFPKSAELYKIAKKRIVFEELFLLQLKLILLKNNYHKPSGVQFKEKQAINQWIEHLPFKMTNAQIKAFEDIKKDMCGKYAMNRLVQGDVGSGKTILAFAAMYLAVLNGKQAILMAPTALLAEQHYESFINTFGDEISVCLLTSDIKTSEKKQIKEELAEGNVQVAIGTHALIQDDVSFYELGLVVTDEQHRFGIRQRIMANQKGTQPHALIMSATPIPRTLSLILYGDMDVSVVDEMPEGRKVIKTHFVGKDKLEQMYAFIDEKLLEGRQVYVVCPLIENSETLDLTSATEHYQEMTNRFAQYAVGLVHGKMKVQEKDDVMKRFKNNEIHILVSTTVIEVGINVPNATVMIIMDSERFGLSQLHQLRGRVGRGDQQSYCFLLSEKLSKTAKERIQTLVNSNSGFDIAEKDLELRGPGEVFGLRQHGLPELKLASIVNDKSTLIEVQKYVKMIVGEFQMNNVEMVEYIGVLSQKMNSWFTL
ncbi:MAG: ATP-dependent DNA helicase RecG [Clostridia bacterium]|nr:ATP-dependent DNA helicase RecG [Clostridia bacterium]